MKRSELKRGDSQLKRTGINRGTKQLKRTAMKRTTKPLGDSSQLTRKPMKRATKPLPAESAKRKAERPLRAAVRATALRAGGFKCSMKDIVPEVECFGGLDVDEIKSRGVNPGGHLDDQNVQTPCRAHHTWRTEHPKEARERGLRKASWD